LEIDEPFSSLRKATVFSVLIQKKISDIIFPKEAKEEKAKF